MKESTQPFLEIGVRIQRIRDVTDRASFAKRLDVSVETLGRYERGERLPSFEFIKGLRDRLDVSADWILFGVEPAADDKALKEKPPEPYAGAAKSTIDRDLLRTAVIAVEIAATRKGLQEGKLEPEKKAKLVLIAYDFLQAKQGPGLHTMDQIMELFE
jgi:transcriptional regulator with XRE-family HTH domain